MNEGRNWPALGLAVTNARKAKFGTVDKARTAAEVSRGAWDRVEQGKSVKDFTLTAIEKALGWPPGRAVAILEGASDLTAPDTPSALAASMAMLRAIVEEQSQEVLAHAAKEAASASDAEEAERILSEAVFITENLRGASEAALRRLSDPADRSDLALAADPGDDATGESESYHQT